MLAKCRSGQFHCAKNDRCIPDEWVCDSEPDCPDGSDEKKCQGNGFETGIRNKTKVDNTLVNLTDY